MPDSAPKSDTLVFPMHVSPIGIFFVIVPTVVILFTGMALWTTKLPLPLIGLLLVVVASCVALAKAAIDEMGAVTIEWSGQCVTIHRVMGSETYYWSHVERIETFDPGATFGDLGRHEEKRIALGLLVCDRTKKGALAEAPPNVLLISRVNEDKERIPKLAERLGNAKRNGGKEMRKLGGAAQAANGKSPKSFRRNSTAAA